MPTVHPAAVAALGYTIGDHVTRDGTDVHVVDYLSEDGFSGSFRCIVAPKSGWIDAGEVEDNLARRYSRVEPPPV